MKRFVHLLKVAFDFSPSLSSKDPVVSVSDGMDQTALHIRKDVPHLSCHSAAQKEDRITFCDPGSLLKP